MAAEHGERQDDALASTEAGQERLVSPVTMSSTQSAHDADEEEDEEESEPRLKYTKLTSQLGSVYRKDDSASACLTSGDKLIIGTHSGNIHVISIPSLRTIKLYRAHSATITSISVSPHAPTISGLGAEAADESAGKPSAPFRQTTSFQKPTSSPHSPKYAVPPTSANSIHIATSSIDGHICVSSLVDPKDITLRNFARPVQALALSPEYKYDRAYISGGPAGNLVLTTGARPGVSSDANTNSTAAAASGWLGQIGLSSSSGKDTILHSGEGSISAIAWSISGKYVAWVNERGIKILRSSSFLDPADAASAWTRIGHIDMPNRRVWQEMAGVWKAKAHWINHRYLEDSATTVGTNGTSRQTHGGSPSGTPTRVGAIEHLLVGWGDAVWIIDVNPKATGGAKTGTTKSFGKVNVVHHFKIDDGVISGLSLYAPQVLITLVYRTRDDNNAPVSSIPETTSPRGIKRRQNGMPPEMRLISLDSASKEELDIEGLVVGRYQSFSAADYHLSTIFLPTPPRSVVRQRGTLGAFGDGLWDVSVGATSRLISSSASVLSASSGEDKTSGSSTQVGSARGLQHGGGPGGLPATFIQPGLKVIVLSPFDCLWGSKRDTNDHLGWLVDQGHFQQAWDLLSQHPEMLQREKLPESRPDTPTRNRGTLADFFADDDTSSGETGSQQKDQSLELKREKRRIGDMWVQQLVDRGEWSSAGEVAEKALDTSAQWEHWLSRFLDAKKFAEISLHLPRTRLKPPISSTYYDSILEFYVVHDASRLQNLLANWDVKTFNVDLVVKALEGRLDQLDSLINKKRDEVLDQDRRILRDCLASLHVADGRPADALKCYIRTRNAEPVIQLVRDYQLYESIASDIFTFITVRLSPLELESASLGTLDDLSSEPVQLLVTATSQNLITVSDVVDQLRPNSPSSDPYLFFYFRGLWHGGVKPDNDAEGEPALVQAPIPQSRRSRFAPIRPANTTRSLLSKYANLTVSLFAEYSPPLLSALIRASDATIDADTTGGSLPYTFEHASDVCKSHGLTSELVYLLAATGQTREALHLIIDEIGDVHRAIAFAREVDDKGIWEDLLQYSLDKPAFIRALLEEVGAGIGDDDEPGGGATTAIDPITLVRRIPDGLAIEGLKDALSHIVSDSEVQCSIAQGAARVLQGEVALLIDRLTLGRARGVAFDIAERVDDTESMSGAAKSEIKAQDTRDVGDATDEVDFTVDSSRRSRHCAICDDLSTTSDVDKQDYLIAYPCGHVYHLGCLFDALTTSRNTSIVDDVQRRLTSAISSDREDNGWQQGRVGAKVARMQMISKIVEHRPCLACERSRRKDEEV